MLARFIIAVFLLSAAYTVLGVSVAVDDNDSDNGNSKETTENAFELNKDSTSSNETRIITLRDVSTQKLKANVSDIESTVNKAGNSTSEIKQDSERVGPCARTTCFTKNGTTTCTPAANCTISRVATSVKLSNQDTEKSTTAKSPIADVSSESPSKKV